MVERLPSAVYCIYHLSLYKKKELTTMFTREPGALQGGCRRSARVCHHAVESHPFGRELRRRGAKSARRSRRALPDLLAAYFLVCFSPRLFEDAQDLTQDFFAMMLKTNWLKHADPNRGRFRSLLLKSLQNFLIKAAEKTHARKRGGGVEFVSWDDWMVEAPSQLFISAQALDSLPPERLFDLHWAATVVEQALRRLREECEGKDRLRLFYALSRHLTAERDEVSYANLSAALGVAETTVKKQLHIMRQRYRCLLRDEVARTVGNPADVEDEIRYLCAALAAGAE